MFEGGGRPSMGGETARLSHVNASSDIARRISILVEAPANRLVATAATAALKAAAEAVTPPPQCAPHHPRGHFLPLHVRTPETSPRGSRLAARDADGTPQAHQKKLWRIASADEPTTPTQQAPLADAASSYEIGAAFRSCEVNSEGTIPVRELGFGLSVLGGGPVASAEPAAILAAAGLQDATRLSLAEFTRCARELTKLRQEAAAAKAIQRRLDEAPARAQPTDENADPFGVAAGAAADAAGAARQSRHSVLGAGGVPKPQPGARPAKELSSQLLRVHGVHAGTAGTVHSFSEEEKAAFASYLSYALADDPDLSGPSGLLPIDPDSLELFEKVRSGVLLCKLVNLAQADAIDERAINTTRRLLRRNAAAEAAAMEAAANGGLPFQPQPAPQLSLFQLTENHNLAICAAKAIGCHGALPPHALACSGLAAVALATVACVPDVRFGEDCIGSGQPSRGQPVLASAARPLRPAPRSSLPRARVHAAITARGPLRAAHAHPPPTPAPAAMRPARPPDRPPACSDQH